MEQAKVNDNQDLIAVQEDLAAGEVEELAVHLEVLGLEISDLEMLLGSLVAPLVLQVAVCLEDLALGSLLHLVMKVEMSVASLEVRLVL